MYTAVLTEISKKNMKINVLDCKDTQKSWRLFDSSAKMFPTLVFTFKEFNLYRLFLIIELSHICQWNYCFLDVTPDYHVL